MRRDVVGGLVEAYGSPAYVYDLAEVRAACADLRAALPGEADLYYSLKANPHPALVRELYELGCPAEVSSPGELEAALTAGVPGDACLYSGPGKGSEEIAGALRRGVRRFSVESPADIDRVGAAAEALGTPVRLILRVNPDVGAGGPGLAMTGVPSQFGADAGWIRESPARFRGGRWARVTGFHVYMGTNVVEPEALLRTFEVGAEVAVSLAGRLGVEPELLDLGGGFGHPFAKAGPRPDLRALRGPLERMLDARVPGWRSGRPRIAFESGRYLVAAAGTLACTVQDVKASRRQAFVVLDSGVNHLGGMAGLRRLPSMAAEPVGPGRDGAEPLRGATVVGPLCTPLDHLARSVDLPPLAPGDVLTVPNVGAYGLTASLLGFLSRPAPAEVVVDGERVVEASRLVISRAAVSPRSAR